ncbi:hypothetical protein BJV74DRAFT_882489 [Russula compacta]|nr:hypothetical protein BJV74DRAFT_882489 [Russula compacta]
MSSSFPPYSVSNLEALFCYCGLPSNPVLVYRNGTTPWEEPTGPEAYRVLDVKSVFSHKVLTVWGDLGPKIVPFKTSPPPSLPTIATPAPQANQQPSRRNLPSSRRRRILPSTVVAPSTTGAGQITPKPVVTNQDVPLPISSSISLLLTLGIDDRPWSYSYDDQGIPHINLHLFWDDNFRDRSPLKSYNIPRRQGTRVCSAGPGTTVTEADTLLCALQSELDALTDLLATQGPQERTNVLIHLASPSARIGHSTLGRTRTNKPPLTT